MLTGYKRLQYLEATGSQYFDLTNCNFSNADFEIEIDSKVSAFRNYQEYWSNTGNNSSYAGWMDSSGTIHYRYNGAQTTAGNSLARYIYRFTHSGSNNIMYRYNVETQASATHTFTKATTTFNENLRLLRCDTQYFIGLIWSIKVSWNGALLYNLVPAVREQDNICGFYNLVDDTFIRSAGTDDFLAGPESLEVTVNVNTTGDGNVTVSPIPAFTSDTITLTAVPSTGYVFTGFKDELGNIITMSRTYTFIANEDVYNFNAGFVPSTVSTNVINQTYDVYKISGMHYYEGAELVKTDLVLSIPRVLHAFQTSEGASYGKFPTGSNSGLYGMGLNATDSSGFDNHVSEPTLISVLNDRDNITNFFNYNPWNVPWTTESGKAYCFRRRSDGYYFSFSIQLSNFSQTHFYDNNDNELAYVGTFLSRGYALTSDNVWWATPGFVGYESDSFTENTGIVLILATGTGTTKKIGIRSDDQGALLFNDTDNTKGLTNWFFHITEHDEGKDPYAPNGTSYQGGGNGEYDLESDPIDDDVISDTVGTNNGGLITVYVPSESELTYLKDYLFNTANSQIGVIAYLDGLGTRLGQAAGILRDPVEYILNFYEAPFPLAPEDVSTRGMKVGYVPIMNLDQTIMQYHYTTKTFYRVDMGSVEIKEYWGNALDYQSTIQIYLPYIGYKTLDARGCMGKTLHLYYNIDLYTGNCVAQLMVNDSILYQFNGNMAYQLPLGQENFNNQMLSNVASGVAALGKVAITAATAA